MPPGFGAQGALSTDMLCLRCRRPFAAHHTPFSVLHLSVPTAPPPPRGLPGLGLGVLQAAPGVRLSHCLSAFFGYEVLHGVQCEG